MEVFRKYALISLSVLLLFPTAVNFAHVFSFHEHKTCDNHSVHMHEQEITCHIEEYKSSPFFSVEFINFTTPEAFSAPIQFPDTYQFLNDYQKLAFVLRGPPQDLPKNRKRLIQQII